MDTPDYDKIAREYVEGLALYDIIRPLGILNGYRVYNYTHSSMVGKKTSLPHFFKIDESGNVIDIEENIEERLQCLNLLSRDV